MPMNILVLHGPNLNLLGERKGDAPERTLEALDRRIRERALTLGQEVKILQSNHEGALVDALHSERKWAQGVLVSPGALARTAYVLAEAIEVLGIPALEVHLDDYRDEDGKRKRSALKAVVGGRVFGKGFESYLVGLERFVTGELDGGKAKRAKARAEADEADDEAEDVDEDDISREVTVTTPGKKRDALRAPEGKRALGKAPPPAKEPEPARKSLGRAEKSPEPARVEAKPGKTLGARPAKDEGEKSLGRREKRPDFPGLSREKVRQRIADKLAGKLTPEAMAAWARQQWLEVQGGAAVEDDNRELFEDALQTMMTAVAPRSKLTDDQLIALLARLDA